MELILNEIYPSNRVQDHNFLNRNNVVNVKNTMHMMNLARDLYSRHIDVIQRNEAEKQARMNAKKVQSPAEKEPENVNKPQEPIEIVDEEINE